MPTGSFSPGQLPVALSRGPLAIRGDVHVIAGTNIAKLNPELGVFQGIQGPVGAPGRLGERGLPGMPGSGLSDGNRGDITVSHAGMRFTINPNVVTNGKLAQMAANTIKANPTGSTADAQDFSVLAESVVGRTSGNLTNITSAVQSALIRGAGSVFWATAANDQVLRRSGAGDLGFGTLVTNNIGNDQVTFPKIQNIDNNRILGRITAATGDIEQLTPTQVTSMLDVFTVSNKGLVPASGGGTTNFLRADGTFAQAAHAIRVNGGGLTQRFGLNFANTATILASGADNAGTNASDITFNVNTDSIDNTMVANMVQARLKGRARGAGTGDPTDLTGTQAGSILRWDTTEDVNVAGLATSVAIAESSTNVRFSNGGAAGIIRSIAAPAEEGQIVFPEMTTTGGDEFIYVHEDTSQTAAERINCPGGRPFRGVSTGPPHMLYYAGRSNRWTIIGPVGGQHNAIVEIDEHFDSGMAQTVESSTPILLPFRNNEFSWAVCGNPLVTGSGGVNSISNVLAHRGIWRIDTGTATNDATCIFLGRDVISGGLATTEDLYDSDNIQRFACWVRIPTDTSVRVIAGFMEDPVNLAGGTEFIGFEADTSGSTSTTNWVLVCREASVSTNVNSGVAWTGAGWHKLEWFRYDEYVIFYINRVFAGIISTNVPNGGGTIAFRVQTRTTSERFVDVDRVIVEVLEASMD